MTDAKPYTPEELAAMQHDVGSKKVKPDDSNCGLKRIIKRFLATIAGRDKDIEELQDKYDKLYNETVRTHSDWNDIAIESDKKIAALQAEVERLTAQNAKFGEQDIDYMAKVGALEGVVDFHKKQVERLIAECEGKEKGK